MLIVSCYLSGDIDGVDMWIFKTEMSKKNIESKKI